MIFRGNIEYNGHTLILEFDEKADRLFDIEYEETKIERLENSIIITTKYSEATETEMPKLEVININSKLDIFNNIKVGDIFRGIGGGL